MSTIIDYHCRNSQKEFKKDRNQEEGADEEAVEERCLLAFSCAWLAVFFFFL